MEQLPLLLLIIIFTLIGGALSVIGAATFLVIPERQRDRITPHMVSFAIGALLGAAFLTLLPHAVVESGEDVHAIFIAVLAGLMFFFLLEKLVLWRHCHPSSDNQHLHGAHHSAGRLILIGDGVHNFLDGILIGSAFLLDPHVGIVTALAVAAHEIPQELGDFAVLLQSGFSRSRALLFNILSSLATVVGGIVAYYLVGTVEPLIPYLLAIAASSFIYIAVADLIPGLHKQLHIGATVQQFTLIATGIAVIYYAHSTLH